MNKNMYIYFKIIILMLMFCVSSSCNHNKPTENKKILESTLNFPNSNIKKEQNLRDTLNNPEISTLVEYVRNNWNSPEDYIIKKFQDFDIIFLSEDHGIKHNLILVQDIVPLLYNSGVYNIGMEFGASEDQKRLDSLVTAPEYNEDIARKIMFNYNVGWAFKEYMDVYRAAWRFNKTLPANAKKFRILNLSYKYNWSSCNENNAGDNPIVQKKRIFYKGGTEWYRANILKTNILKKNEKILVLVGGSHAFTKYKRPIFDALAPDFYRLDDRYFGNIIYEMAPNKVFTILLHFPFYSKRSFNNLVYPACGLIDKTLSNFTNQRVGIDLTGTPMGELRDTSFFSIGHPNFKLSDMADGYIYQKPFNKYKGCAIDEKFLTSENWSEAQLQYPNGVEKRPKSKEGYLKQIREYNDFKLRYKNLK